MWARVSTSSGPMWMNWDAVQHAVHVAHGTSASCSPFSAPRISWAQDENSPAGNEGGVSVRPPTDSAPSLPWRALFGMPK
jgi:hypothetical protein